MEDGTGIVFDDAGAESTTVTLTDTGGIIRANFDAGEALTVGDDGNGTTTPSGAVAASLNVPVTVSAVPSPGCVFSHWSILSGSGVVFGNVNDTETTITLSEGPAEIQAVFFVWPQGAKVLPSDGAANDDFGASVSLSGDYAVMGSPGDDDNGDMSGSAYIFHREGSTWTEQAKLLPDDGAAMDYFGQAVSISDDHALVNSQNDGDNRIYSGSAYFFCRNDTNWIQQKKLLPDDVSNNEYFGKSLSLDGNSALCGTVRDGDNGLNSGSAYIFGAE